MRVSHMSAALQAKAFADAAAWNEEQAKIKRALHDHAYDQSPEIMKFRRLQIQAYTQFARQCREECRRLQSVTQGRAA